MECRLDISKGRGLMGSDNNVTTNRTAEEEAKVSPHTTAEGSQVQAQRGNGETAEVRARVGWGRDAGEEVRGEKPGAPKDLGTSTMMTGKAGMSHKMNKIAMARKPGFSDFVGSVFLVWP